MKVESKKQKLSVELQAYREDQERKVRLLTEEISRQQEQHAAQTEQLAGDNSKLEHRLGGTSVTAALGCFVMGIILTGGSSPHTHPFQS